jgi:hypothetical protein
MSFRVGNTALLLLRDRAVLGFDAEVQIAELENVRQHFVEFHPSKLTLDM